MKSIDKTNYFILHADCIATKGFARSLVSDFLRIKYYYIPNDLYDVLVLTKTKTLNEIYSLYSPDNEEVLNEYFEFLLLNNLGFIDNEREVFPDLSLEWDAPSLITNSIIDVDAISVSELNYKSLFQDLSSFNCACVQIRSFGSLKVEDIQTLMECTLNTRIKEIRLVLEYSSTINEFVVSTLIPNNKRVSQVILFNSPEDKSEYVMGVQIMYSGIMKLSEKDCGQICPASFSVNIPHHTEALSFNSCLNRKLSVDSKGFIKNCPSQKLNYGHIKNESLSEVIKNNQFQSFWKIKKDDIKICKDCEHRYICTDCRIFTQDQNDPFSKPQKCSYDPYTAAWG